MNAANDNHDPTTVDDLHNRLVDRGLAELIGNDTPPDLSSRILAANDAGAAQKLEKTSVGVRRRTWMVFAVAATLLIGTTAGVLLTNSKSREAARGSAKLSRESQMASNLKQPSHLRLGEAIPESGDSTAGSTWTKRESNELRRNFSIVASQTHAVPDADYGTPTNAPAEIAIALDSSGAAPTSAPRSEQESDRYSLSLESRLAVGGQTPNMSPGLLAFVDKSKQLHETPRESVSLGYQWHSQYETAEGTGPGLSGDQYTRIVENPFIKAEGGAAVSTFSIDVDTASYTNVRQFLLEMKTLPPPDAVRIEELVNYFDYNYAGPNASSVRPPAEPGADEDNDSTADSDVPFAAHVEVAGCPWAADHRLVRIGIKGRELDRDKRPKSNLVFLIDVSGSMDEPNKLPLVVYGLQQLTRELGEIDRVAIVVYASSEGLVLPSTPGSKQQAILDALGHLEAGGSTAGGAGIQLAYQIAEDNFIEGGTNRVILCTDGDFNVGVTSTAELERLCERKAKDTRVFLSVLGFGRGNLNDAMMEAISNHGNGNYHYVDNRTEARRVLVEEMTGTLVTIAKDVKIQVEFNPRKVAGYRLLGYENRMLRTEDFNDDKKDAGEIGAGHTVTALYEVVPADKPVDVTPVDDLKYQQPLDDPSRSQPGGNDADIARELLTLKMRYKQPDGDTSDKLEWSIMDDGKAFSAASGDYQFAAAVAGFGMLLRDSHYKGNLTYAAVLELAQAGIGEDKQGYRSEFLDMVRQAKSLKGE